MTIGLAQIALEDELTDFMSAQFGYVNSDFIDKLRWWGDFYSISYADNIARCKSAMETGSHMPDVLYFAYKQAFDIDAGP